MQATYYDGRTAAAHPVDLAIDGETLLVSGEGIDRRDPIGAVVVTDTLGSTLRLLRFVDGASCEVSDNAAFAMLLRAHGVQPSRVSGWEKSWPVAITALVLILVTGFLGYRYGLPAAARSAADNLPDSALDAVSLQIQQVLDATVFDPTKISGDRMAPLLNAFDRMQFPDDLKPRLNLTFRNAEELGANAMALPSGMIFVTDQLVELTANDEILLAVIAHEAGHVEKRHGMRQVLQSTALGLFVTWYLGDVSALGAAAPTALLEAKYSRDLEREADAYAARILKLNGLAVSRLAEALELIEKSHGAGGSDAGPLAYLSSHPATVERLAWIRGQ